jgi:hypothetical protein
MGSVRDWQEILAGIRALYDLVKFGSDYSTSFLRYRSEIEIYREAQRVSGIFHTSRREIDALISDIADCRHCITESKVEDRARCLCSIFNNIKDGNQGVLPIGDWVLMYRELGCGSEELEDMSDPDDRPMDADEEARAARLTEAELRTIDECILSNITCRFQKTARVVVLAMNAMGNRFRELPPVFYSGRIKSLAAAGVIEAAGNLNCMRFSEVRLPQNENR